MTLVGHLRLDYAYGTGTVSLSGMAHQDWTPYTYVIPRQVKIHNIMRYPVVALEKHNRKTRKAVKMMSLDALSAAGLANEDRLRSVVAMYLLQHNMKLTLIGNS